MTAVFILRRDPAAAAQLQSELASTPRTRIAGVAHSVRVAREQLDPSGADIVVADLRLDDGSVLALAHELHPVPPSESPPKLLLGARAADDPLLIEALRAGADGYVIEGDASRSIGMALAETMRDEAVLAPPLVRQVTAYFSADAARPTLLKLSDADRELLLLLGRGLLPWEIARQMAETTASDVRRRVRQVLRKMQWDLRAGMRALQGAAATPAAAPSR